MQQNQWQGWTDVLLFLAGGLAFVGAALFVSRFIRPNRPNPEKLAAYESGESAIGSPWIQFNVRFYVVALIFLLFEVEIVFLFPWATIFADKELATETAGLWGWMALAEMIIFVVVLGIGLAYAWVNGHLDWIQPHPKVADYPSPVPKELYDKINERYKS